MLKKNGQVKTYTEFCQAINVRQQNFNDIKSGRRYVTTGMLQDMAARYPVSLDYIITGKKSPESKQEIVKPVVVTLDQSGQDNIAMVDAKAAAGYLAGHTDPEFFHELPVFNLPDARFRNGTFRCFQVEGDSMNDTIYHNDWVIARYADDPRNTRDGFVHVIVTNDGIVVKRLFNTLTKNRKLTLVSDNDEFPPYEVHGKDVKEIWYVVAKLSYYLPTKPNDLKEQVEALQASLGKLSDEVRKLKKK